MKSLAGLTLGLALALALSGCTASMDKSMSMNKSMSMDKSMPIAKPLADTKIAHAHMGHVTTAWGDTPQGQGLLPVAIAEAKVAALHATFAASRSDDLLWMQLHTRHVLHTIDPSLEPKGPGLDYGVSKAAAGTLKHINLAAKSAGASANIKAHALHVATAAENTLTRAEDIVLLANRVLAASSADEAYPWVQQISQLATALVEGVDANADGVISWERDEGGLKAASKHMGIMAKGEGMN